MQHRMLYLLGALLLGLCMGCAASTVAVTPMEMTVHDHAASGVDNHHGKHYHGKITLDPNAPASFAERPVEGTHFTCPVSGGVFEVEPRTRVSFYEGRHYAFCCGGCAQDFDADPDFFVNRLKKSRGDQ